MSKNMNITTPQMIVLVFLTSVLIILQIFAHHGSQHEELILVHVIFRHGDRTPDLGMHYKNDPYINDKYYPYGHGELTNKGKASAYRLGIELRTTYDEFLGKIYTPDLLYAQSSAYNRTKMTLQLVLAGLFPPDSSQQFAPGLNWQPIPFYYKEMKDDNMIFTFRCPSVVKYVNSFVRAKKYSKFDELFSYLSQHVGHNVTNLVEGLQIYLILKAQKELEYTLPDWATKIDFDFFQQVMVEFYKIFATNEELLKLFPGNLFNTIIDTSTAKSQDQLIPNRKLYLWSGHDFCIAAILMALNLYDDSEPPYSSYIAFEVVKRHSITGIKIFYQDYSTDKRKLLKLPNCMEWCPIDQFREIIQDILPPEEIKCH